MRTFKIDEDTEITVPNLQVLKLMQSLTSRGYVRTTFNWQWNYYFLTDEGIEYLREYLHLPVEIVPNTLKKPATRAAREGGAPGGAEEGDRPLFDKNKGVGPGSDFNPSFQGGRGRGGYRQGGEGRGGFGRGQ